MGYMFLWKENILRVKGYLLYWSPVSTSPPHFCVNLAWQNNQVRISYPFLDPSPPPPVSAVVCCYRTAPLCIVWSRREKCCECERSMTQAGHFTAYLCCTKCRYSSCCNKVGRCFCCHGPGTVRVKTKLCLKFREISSYLILCSQNFAVTKENYWYPKLSMCTVHSQFEKRNEIYTRKVSH
jgi:hypothetical protein